MARMSRKRQAPIGNGGNNGGGYGYGYNGYDGDNVSWWWTPTGMAVRYSLVALFFATILVFFVGGYYHARRRLKRGQPPLPYHRWMVRRQYYYPAQPRYMNPYHSQQSYGMDGYPPPPPAYNNAEGPPPVYQPPPGATKAMADQSLGQTHRAGEGSGSAGASAGPPLQQ